MNQGDTMEWGEVREYNASTTAPQTSEEHRLEEEYLAGGEVGEGTCSCTRKHKLDVDTESLPGMRRVKKNSGKDKSDAIVDSRPQSMIARKEKDLAKAEKLRAQPTKVTSSMVEEFSIIDCMAVLEATPNVSSTSYLMAIKFFPKLSWRKIFLSMSEDKRKTWLDSLGN